jgi:hypothetical protein
MGAQVRLRIFAAAIMIVAPFKSGSTRMFRLASIAVVAYGIFGQAEVGAQGTPEDVTMAVPNITFNLTATFIADELGLWARHGLRFKMIQVTGIGAANAVIAGSADFSQGGGSTLTRAAARGQRLLAIASTADKTSSPSPCARSWRRASTPTHRSRSGRKCCAGARSRSAPSRPIRTPICG